MLRNLSDEEKQVLVISKIIKEDFTEDEILAFLIGLLQYVHNSNIKQMLAHIENYGQEIGKYSRLAIVK